jgi:ABC-type multidrug transport system fused ATPase/permease subunit
MITHRLSTVKHADQIIVMSGGSVEAIGKHRDLLRRSRTYQRLWRAQ